MAPRRPSGIEPRRAVGVRLRVGRFGVAGLLAAALVLLGLGTFDLATLALDARDAIQTTARIRRQVFGAGTDAATLRTSSDALKATAARLARVRHGMDRYSPVLTAASVVPPLGRWNEDARTLVEIHHSLTLTASATLEMTARLLDELMAPRADADEPLPALLDFLTAERESIREQLTAIDEAIRRLDRAPNAGGNVLDSRQAEDLRNTATTLRTVLHAALLAPQALGSPVPQRYLLLAQKSDELRPTGGFIGNVAFVTLADGEPRDLTYLRSYLVEDPTRPRVPAPPPFRGYQGMRDWNLRDANWHPDFRSSADEIHRFLALNGVEPVDGVLAFDQQALGILLAAIGPVRVPGHEVRVTTANAYTVLEHFAHSTGDRRAWFSARPFYADLTAALLQATTERLRADPGSVIGAVQAMVTEKHLLAAFENVDLQRLAERVGAGGRVPPTTDDLLYVVDAQVDHGAPFRSIDQTINYRPEPITGRATLTIDYVNNNSHADPNGRLADYVRVYVPAGSRLTLITGLIGAQPARQVAGLTEFAGFLELPAGAEQRVEIQYWLPPRLPARWSASGYALQVLKQPGTDGHRLVIEIPQRLAFDGRLATDLTLKSPYQ